MFARVLTTTGLGLGLLLAGIAVVAEPGVALGGVAVGVFAGVLGAMWVRNSPPGDAVTTTRAARRAGLLVAAGTAGGWLTLAGLVVLLGAATGPALLLLAVVTLSAWWWRHPRTAVAALRANPLRTVRDRLLSTAHQPAPPPRVAAPHENTLPLVSLPPAEPAPASLSTRQLCLAWQRTYFALLDLPAGPPHSEVVALRGLLLDEIERRDPLGFTRWLDTGARASSNPGRYLAGDG